MHAAEKCGSFHEIANCTDAKHKKHQKIIYQSVLKIAQRWANPGTNHIVVNHFFWRKVVSVLKIKNCKGANRKKNHQNHGTSNLKIAQ